MSSKTPVFILGGTGYIGGSLLARLLAHPDAGTFDITVLARSPEKVAQLQAFGVTPVLGSLKDLELLEDLASKAHVVLSCADCLDLPSIEALLKGMRKRHATGDLPILIHTSGTGVLTSGANTGGMSVTEKVYDDSDPDDIEKSLPETTPHRHIDLSIVRADEAGYLRAYIVLPGTIWGVARNSLVDAGIINPHSIAIRFHFGAALARGRTGVIGKGLAVWPAVEIEELMDLYVILFDSATKNPGKAGHGRDGYYFGIGNDSEYSMVQLASAIGEAMVEAGVHKESAPTTFAQEELAKYFGSEEMAAYFGANSRGVANHSKSLGWNPKKGVKDMLVNARSEIKTLLAKQQQK